MCAGSAPCKYRRAPCRGVEREQGSADAREHESSDGGSRGVDSRDSDAGTEISHRIRSCGPSNCGEGDSRRQPSPFSSPCCRRALRFDDPRDAGVAWNVLGQSYLDLDRYAEARQAYQHAMEILRPIPSARAQYASTLDSMGMLEASLGQRDAAKSAVRERRDRSMRSSEIPPGWRSHPSISR